MSGDLAHYQNGMLKIIPYQHQPDARVEQVFISPDGSVLGATAFGLIGWKDGKKQILTVRNGLPCNGINAIIADRENAALAVHPVRADPNFCLGVSEVVGTARFHFADESVRHVGRSPARLRAL